MIFQHRGVVYMSMEQGIRDHLQAEKQLFFKATSSFKVNQSINYKFPQIDVSGLTQN